MKVIVVIPAYNEETVIESVVKDVYQHIKNIVVVDDHSSDNTASLAFKSGATVIKHPINLGQGAALQTGFNYALKEGADIIVTFDADGQHRVEDALAMIQIVASHKADVVCGSRFLGIDSTTMPFSKKIWLKLAVIFTRLITGVNVTDAHNGLRALSRKAVESIVIRQNRMSHASEIIAKVKKYGLMYQEIPVQIIYTEYSLSKGQKLKNSFNILKELFIGSLSK